MLKFISDETHKSYIIIEKVHCCIQIPMLPQGTAWVSLGKGIARIRCPWGVSFVWQIPTYAQVGGVGLDIDRCIVVSYVAMNSPA